MFLTFTFTFTKIYVLCEFYERWLVLAISYLKLPTINKLEQINSIKLMTRCRLVFSHFRECKLKHNLQDSVKSVNFRYKISWTLLYSYLNLLYAFSQNAYHLLKSSGCRFSSCTLLKRLYIFFVHTYRKNSHAKITNS